MTACNINDPAASAELSWRFHAP